MFDVYQTLFRPFDFQTVVRCLSRLFFFTVHSTSLGFSDFPVITSCDNCPCFLSIFPALSFEFLSFAFQNLPIPGACSMIAHEQHLLEFAVLLRSSLGHFQIFKFCPIILAKGLLVRAGPILKLSHFTLQVHRLDHIVKFTDGGSHCKVHTTQI